MTNEKETPPDRVWITWDDAYPWTTPATGGTEYVRADLIAPASAAPVVDECSPETTFMVSEPSMIDCSVCGGRFALSETLIVKNAAGRPERTCKDCSQGKPKVEADWPARLTIIRYDDGGFSATEAVPPAGAKFTCVYYRDPAAATAVPQNDSCVLCGHDAVRPDGTCAEIIPICADSHHGTRPCGCKCRFPNPAAPAEQSSRVSGEQWLAQRGFADSRTYSSVEIGALLEEFAASKQ